MPESVMPEPTNMCNSKCVFCPQSGLRRPRGNMSFEIYRAIVDQANEAGSQRIMLERHNERDLEEKMHTLSPEYCYAPVS